MTDTKQTANAVTNGAKREVRITAGKFETMIVDIVGTAPLVQHRFWKKAEIMAKQAEGSKGGKRKIHSARDFEADYLKSAHRATAGWYGIPAAAFRNAVISACKLVGFVMTRAKISVWVEHDGLDEDGYPLVRITQGEPHRHDAYVRNDNGVVDIRSRAMFDHWSLTLRVTFDADQFSAEDVVNLIARAGRQVGIGEGRFDSKDGYGMGWGTFRVLTAEEQAHAVA